MLSLGGPQIPLKSLFRELRIWTSLSHDNILACLGFAVFDDGVLCLISPWMENGNIQEYIAQHPNTDRKNWVRHLMKGFNGLYCNTSDQVCGVASGLKYLHSVGIIHADIRSVSVSEFLCLQSTNGILIREMYLLMTVAGL